MQPKRFKESIQKDCWIGTHFYDFVALELRNNSGQLLLFIENQQTIE